MYILSFFANIFTIIGFCTRAFQWCIICHIWTSNMGFRGGGSTWPSPQYIIQNHSQRYPALKPLSEQYNPLQSLKSKPFLENYKHWYLIHIRSDKAFKGNVVNRDMSSLHEGLLKTTLQPLPIGHVKMFNKKTTVRPKLWFLKWYISISFYFI